MGTLVLSIQPPTGYPFHVVVDDRLSDNVTQSLAKGESWLNDEWHLLQLFMPNGARVLDLGAHIGSFSLAAAAMGCDVLAVEASPANAELIRASVRENGFSNYRLANVAVGAERGEVHFLCGGPYGYIVPHPEKGSITVPIVPTDELLRDQGWKKVDFIKMDIEGAEVQALRGMKELLCAPEAPPIYYESNGYTLHNIGGTSCQELKKKLEEFGYRNFLYRHGQLIPVTATECQPAIVTDYLALKPSWVEKIAGSGWKRLLRGTQKACRRIVNGIRRRIRFLRPLNETARIPRTLTDLKFRRRQTDAELLQEFLNLRWNDEEIVRSHLLRELRLAPLEIQNHPEFRTLLAQSTQSASARAA